MKKRYLFSIPALVFSFSAAHAQSSPPPWPGPNYPTIYGSGVSLGNVSTIQQIGSNEHVGSSGSGGTVYGVDQSVSGRNSGNYSEIYQGTRNSASSDNSATVKQQAAAGAKNSADTTQDGKGNTAATQQNTNASAAHGQSVTFSMPAITFTNGVGATSTVAASSAIQAVGTFISTIDQSNDNNKAHVYQGMNGAAATGTAYSAVKQTGRSTVAAYQLGGSNNWSSVNQSSSTATVTQDGSAGHSNVSGLNQTGGARNDTITQLAYGGDNKSYVAQTGGTAIVTQVAFSGTNSSAVQQMGGIANISQFALASGTNSSTAWQSGGSVSVTQDIYSRGGKNTSDLTQTGGSATVIQSAFGGTDNSIIRSDEGSSLVTQTAFTGLITNDSTIVQSGANTAIVTQSAYRASNTSNITQNGSGNFASVWQH